VMFLLHRRPEVAGVLRVILAPPMPDCGDGHSPARKIPWHIAC